VFEFEFEGVEYGRVLKTILVLAGGCGGGGGILASSSRIVWG
jgi:hypothetical protein